MLIKSCVEFAVSFTAQSFKKTASFVGSCKCGCQISIKINESSDAKASKCHLKFSSRMLIFIELVDLSSVISLK